MTLHSLKSGNARCGLSDFAVRFPAHALGGDHFHEFVDRKAAGIMRGPLGWQDVVGAGTFVAEGDGGFFADKQRTVTLQMVNVPVIGAGMELKMLRRILIGYPRCLFLGVTEDDLAISRQAASAACCWISGRASI